MEANTTDYEYDYEDSNEELYWFANVLIIVVAVITLIGNSLTIAAFAKYKVLRRVGNYFLVSLAVADLGSGVIWLLSMVNFGECSPILEDVIYSVTSALITSSLLHLVLVSVDRFILITYPVKYNSKMTQKAAGIIIAITWVSMIFLNCGPVFMYATKEFECEPIVSEHYWNISGFACYLLTMPTMTIIYIRIMVMVKTQPSRITDVENTIISPSVSYVATGYSNLDNTSATNVTIKDLSNPIQNKIAKKNAQRRRKSLTILLILILATFILWTPTMIYSFLAALGTINPMVYAKWERRG